MEQKNRQIIIQQTGSWIGDFIVEHNICPFAGREVEKDSIRFEVFSGDDVAESLQQLLSLCALMDEDSNVETSLFIYADALSDFYQFLDILDVANSLLVEEGYEGIYQLASFHPDYCFQGADVEDAANFTNRSPYPMFHLLREKSLEKVLSKFPNPEEIPQRNIEYCRELGTSKIKQLQDNLIKS
jgi:hypothetical protein